MNAEDTKKIYDAIEVVREALPIAALVIETADPGLVPFVEAAKVVLGKVFEAISMLESHGGDPEQAAHAYRLKLHDRWQTGLEGK